MPVNTKTLIEITEDRTGINLGPLFPKTQIKITLLSIFNFPSAVFWLKDILLLFLM